MSAGSFRHFGGMCWPAPGERLSECTHSLVWANSDAKHLQVDRLVAASVITAYQELIRLPAKKRDAIIRELRKGPNNNSAEGGV